MFTHSFRKEFESLRFFSARQLPRPLSSTCVFLWRYGVCVLCVVYRACIICGVRSCSLFFLFFFVCFCVPFQRIVQPKTQKKEEGERERRGGERGKQDFASPARMHTEKRGGREKKEKCFGHTEHDKRGCFLLFSPVSHNAPHPFTPSFSSN